MVIIYLVVVGYKAPRGRGGRDRVNVDTLRPILSTGKPVMNGNIDSVSQKIALMYTKKYD